MRTDAEYLEAIQSRIDKTPCGCWEWQGSRNSDGYGNVRYHGRVEKTHRLMYKLAVGEIGNLHVCHHCDNPCCINPEHLFLGTHKENMHDAISKDRLPIVREGAKAINAKFTLDEVDYYRRRYQKGMTNDQIVSESGKSKTAVCSMIQGRTYKEVVVRKRKDVLVNVRGPKGPRFKGYYITPWGEFASLHDAVKGKTMHFSTIHRYCVTNNLKIARQSSAARSTYLTQQDVGKTYAELGFGFREVT